MGVIGKTKYNDHTSPIFKRFNVIKLPDLCAWHDLRFRFKLIDDLLPHNFQSFSFLW